MKTPESKVGIVTSKLPRGYYLEIGRILVYWGHIEHLLRRATYDAAGVSQKLGRVALMEPKPEAVPDQIRKIFLARKLPPPEMPKQWKTDLGQLYEWRNAFAHGVWIKRPERRYPVLQYLKGSHQPMPNAPGSGIPYKVDPMSYSFTVGQLRDMANTYAHYIKIADRVRAAVKAALPPSPEK